MKLFDKKEVMSAYATRPILSENRYQCRATRLLNAAFFAESSVTLI
jgi:hypothetical protein